MHARSRFRGDSDPNCAENGPSEKIHVVNGEELKIVSSDDVVAMKEEIIESEAKLVKSELGNQLIEGADGQHYVVLEVIQLQGGDGEQAVAVVSEGDFQGGTLTIDGSNADQFITPDYEEHRDNKTLLKISKNSVDSASDVQNCFGFDEEEEEME